MEFTEKNLEDIIFNGSRVKLSQKGLHIEGKLFRQVKIGNYGICDLLEIERPFYCKEEKKHWKYFYVKIYELKKNEINFDSYSQILRYAKGIKSFFEKRGFKVDISLILIGREISQVGGFCYLNQFSDVRVVKYSYNEDGIVFNEPEFVLTNEGF